MRFIFFFRLSELKLSVKSYIMTKSTNFFVFFQAIRTDILLMGLYVAKSSWIHQPVLPRWCTQHAATLYLTTTFYVNLFVLIFVDFYLILYVCILWVCYKYISVYVCVYVCMCVASLANKLLHKEFCAIERLIWSRFQTKKTTLFVT